VGNSLPGVGKIAKNWREVLKPEEYAVLREGGTERAFTGEYWDTKTEGVYSCRACGTELFRSAEKFESHCGWQRCVVPPAIRIWATCLKVKDTILRLICGIASILSVSHWNRRSRKLELFTRQYCC